MDLAIKNATEREGCFDVALYLEGPIWPAMLDGACRWGRLDLVKYLAKEHRVNLKVGE